MAKHSALFEVIMRDRPLHQQRRPGFIRAVSSWFKPRPQDMQGISLSRAVPPVEEAPSICDSSPLPSMTSYEPVTQSGLRVESEQRQIAIRLSYTAAAICGIALITVVAAAFMVGQKTARQRPALADMSNEEHKQMPAQGSVVDLSGMRRTTIEAAELPEQAGSGAVAASARPAAGGTAASHRTAGLNYVIVQSYPAAEKDMAYEARDLLIRNGIECTVEENLPGYHRWAVVGMLGFSRISNNAQLEAYKKKIMQISDSQGKKNSFKAFAPTTYIKWKKSQ